MTRIDAAHVGFMDLERWFPFWHAIGARVLLDGEDVTLRCVAFTGRLAKLLIVDEAGAARAFADGSGFEYELRRGHVEVAVP